MKNLKNFIEQNKFFVFGLILSTSLLWPLFVAPFFLQHEGVQIARLYEMDKCFQDLQIPCRWVPDLAGNYGLPLFNYYAPVPYYFGELFYKISGSLTFSVKTMFALAFIGSYIFMYLLSKKIWGQLGGSLTALLFVFAPYHSLVTYVLGDMGELWGLMFLPGLIWAMLNLFQKTSIKNVIILSLLIALTITSYDLSIYLYLPFALICLFLNPWLKLNPGKVSLGKYYFYSFLAVALGLTLSAFYFLPSIWERNLINTQVTTSGYFTFTEHFKGLKKIFFDYSWQYGQSNREYPGSKIDGLSYQIGIIVVLTWLSTMILLIRRKDKIKFKNIIIFFSVIGLFSIFMINPRSEFIWRLIIPLKFLQFPWRFLGIVVFSFSLVSGGIFLSLPANMQKKVWIALAILLIFTTFNYFKPEKFIYLTDQELLSGDSWTNQIMNNVVNYLPKSAELPKIPAPKFQILTGETAQVIDFKQGSNWIFTRVKVNDHTIFRLSQYYFPNWKVKVDGIDQKINYQDSTGLMTFILGKGDHTITAQLRSTPIRLISNLLSFFSVIAVVFLALFQTSRARKWADYYLKAFHR